MDAWTLATLATAACYDYYLGFDYFGYYTALLGAAPGGKPRRKGRALLQGLGEQGEARGRCGGPLPLHSSGLWLRHALARGACD